MRKGEMMLKKKVQFVLDALVIRVILAIILTLVNQINTGGDKEGAHGFSLDALLKLNEVRVGWR